MVGVSGVPGELKETEAQDCGPGGGSQLELELGTRASACKGPKQQGHRWGLGPVFLEICFPGLT